MVPAATGAIKLVAVDENYPHGGTVTMWANYLWHERNVIQVGGKMTPPPPILVSSWLTPFSSMWFAIANRSLAHVRERDQGVGPKSKGRPERGPHESFSLVSPYSSGSVSL